MKKTLLAAALLAGFAGAASAQSSVTLYGIVDGGLRYQKASLSNGDGVSNFGLAYGQQSGNRFGLRGVEDIGGGNRITFQLENGFELGNGTALQDGRLFGRQAWLGIENDSWGYTRIGRQVNFASQYIGSMDPFGVSFGTANMGAAFGAANTDRLSNTIAYQTPNMSGFQAGIGYSFANGATAQYADPRANGSTGYNFATNNNTRQLTLGAKYGNGPVLLAASYDKIFGAENATAFVPAGTPLLQGRPTATTGVSGQTINSWNIAGSYDFKVAKVVAAYGQTRDGFILGAGAGGSGATFNNNPVFTGSTGNSDVIFAPSAGSNSYMVGATIPVNPVSRVLVSWTMLTPNGNLKAPLAEGGYNAQNQVAYNIGYTYDFTKRTNMYAYFTMMDNVGMVDTAKATTVGLGLRHQF